MKTASKIIEQSNDMSTLLAKGRATRAALQEARFSLVRAETLVKAVRS